MAEEQSAFTPSCGVFRPRVATEDRSRSNRGPAESVSVSREISGTFSWLPPVETWGSASHFQSRTLEVKIGGTTLADDWTIRSSRRFKTNIQPLQDALGRIEALQGVSYERKSDGKHEIGVVAEDVDRVVPEVVAHDPETQEVEGVDYSRLVALLIEAVKSQQAEIERLKSQMAQLTSNAAKQ